MTTTEIIDHNQPTSCLESAPLDSESFARLAKGIEERGMVTPAIFVLEMYKPLTTVAHAGVLFCSPLLFPLVGGKLLGEMQKVLESRNHIEMLIQELEKVA